MTLILVLATIAVLFVPSVQDGDKASTGARQLMSMLQIAKTRAMRDQAPRGVRLVPTDPNHPNQITQLQYIQQPPDFYDPRSAGPSPPPIGMGNIVSFAAQGVPSPDFWGGFGNNPPLWPVQPGDYLEINGGGLLRRILAVPPGNVPNMSNQLVLAGIVNTTGQLQGAAGGFPATITVPGGTSVSPGMSLSLGTGPTQESALVMAASGPTVVLRSCLQPAKTTFLVQNDPPLAIPANCPYRIVRGPRVVAGEDALTLPVDVAIQLGASVLMPNGSALSSTYDPPLSSPAGGGPWYDILFSPSGAVVGSAASNDKIVLWVRDVTQFNTAGAPDVTANSPLLVCVYTRSGLLAAHSVDVTPGGNPYSFTVDGRSSGE